MTSQLNLLKEIVSVQQDDSDPSHDILHIARVVKTCERLGAELGANLGLLLPAAWLHDIINIPKNHPDRILASQKAADEARIILARLEYAAEDSERILQIIKEHSFSAGHAPSSLESQILQDADRLDAIGAIGILRLATCGVKLGAKFYHPNDPFAETRELDDKAYSIDHIFKKLLKLESLMNTEPARIEAKRRTEFLESYLKELQSEIS